MNVLRQYRFQSATLGLLLLAVAIPGWSMDTTETAKLLPTDSETADQFGFSVAVDGDTAVIGAFGEEDYRGAAYVFLRDGGGRWTQQAKLVASDGEAQDWFGRAVAVDDDRVLIGAKLDDNLLIHGGSAYVFVRDEETGTWTEEAKLIAYDETDFDQFGQSVALDDDTAVIGAYTDDDNGTSSGSAYVFRRDEETETWIQEAKLLAPDGTDYDFFGTSVALHDNVILVGASGPFPFFNVTGHPGSAYLFARDDATSEWIWQATLVPSDGAEYDRFGASVALDDEKAVVGAPYDDDNIENSGSAYIFVPDEDEGWTEAHKLLPAAGAGKYSQLFGYAVAIEGDAAVIGAPLANVAGRYVGAAYLFQPDPERASWTEQARLVASDGTTDDALGSSVALDEGTVVVGAPTRYPYTSPGAAYVFTLEHGKRQRAPECSTCGAH